jgi:TolB-like protein/Flp pilus assembly protein TadD
MLPAMEAGNSRDQEVRQALDRVLSSACFARSDRHSKLLRFLVERHLEGRDDELKESLIGVEVFGRRPDYDPNLDSTVRTEAVRLRARLSQYYSAEGREDPLVIEVPKGGYLPRCRPRAVDDGHAPHTKARWLAIGLTGLIVAAIGAGVRWAASNTAPVPMAVLPLVNLSGDSRYDYFVDGLTDEIIRQVSGIRGLAVRSQTSSFALKGKPATVHEAGNQLNVQYIVEGSLSGREPQMRITARLIRVRDDVALWTGAFDREVRDALSIQQDISRGIVNALKFKLGLEPRSYDPEAYDLYLRARAARNMRFAGDDEVIGLFEQAIGKDPSIGPAYSGLADAYAFRSMQGPLDPHRAEELDKLRTAAERAIQLDPLLAEAHSALGTAYASQGQWDLAERSFRRAIEIDPSLSSARDEFARFVLWPLGRMSEAVREARAGTEDDPLSSRAQYELADVLLAAGQFDEAAHYCEQLPADMVSVGECVGRARLAQGRAADAIQVLSSSTTNNWGYLAYAYAKAGRREQADALTAAAPMRYPNRRGPFQYALVFAGFEDKDRTVEQLQRMAGVGPVRMGFTLRAPEFAFLEGDPRIKALRHQLGLPQ